MSLSKEDYKSARQFCPFNLSWNLYIFLKDQPNLQSANIQGNVWKTQDMKSQKKYILIVSNLLVFRAEKQQPFY